MHRSINIGIIGTGKLGTDLLIKTMRSEHLNCAIFSGRNANSGGIKKAQGMKVATSTQSIDAINDFDVDLVFDVTSAEHHRKHAPILAQMGIRAIDLTPSKVGPFCVPSINPQIINKKSNINLVTCGGQSALPIIHCVSSVIPQIDRVDVHSMLAEDSVGPATLANIDDYYATTIRAIREYSGVTNANVELSVEKSAWKPDMLTEIRIWAPNRNLEALYGPLKQRLELVRQYVPGYHIVGTPRYRSGYIHIAVSVCGLGDWIPSHAGNLDIINCAAIAAAETYAKNRHSTEKPKQNKDSSFRNYFGRFTRRKADATA